ncbi:MAG: hypothetical protein ACXVPQ_01740 [Bacteroidia bacterium]
MGTLSENWITENLMDFEYKKYILLDYLQQVEAHFNEQKLYPDLAELIAHYKNLVRLKQNTNALESQFRKSVKGIDLEHLKLIYEKLDDESLSELKQIIEFSEPLMVSELAKGKTIFDQAEQNIIVDHIGILPIYRMEGYFLLYPYQSKDVIAYNYSFAKINLLQQEVYGLNCSYFSTFTISLSQTVDRIKQELIYTNPQFPNPPVYLFKAQSQLPNDETFLPIAKRLLYKTLLNTSD